MKFRTWLKLRRKQQGENAVEHEEVLHARDGYRSAFETLQVEATRSRQEAVGYRSTFEIAQADIDLIKRLNTVDHALHARAMQRFEARGAAARYKAEAISI